jgi:hypothetical protein
MRTPKFEEWNMDIRVVETPKAPLKKRTPAQLAKGRQTVTVLLEQSITLEVDGMVVTYPSGFSQAPCEIANALFSQGGEFPGTDIKRDIPKKQTQWPEPTRGGLAGCIRFNI